MADIFINTVDILSLILLLWIIQFYIQPGTPHRLPLLPEWLLGKDAVVFICLFFFLFVLKNFFGYLVATSLYRFVGSVAIRISRNKLAAFQAANMEEFVATDSSVYIRSICYQPFEFAQYMLSGFQQIITQLFLICATIVAILWFNASVFLLLLILLMPPVVIVFFYIKRRLGFAKKKIQSNNEQSFQYVLDALKGYVEANVYDRNEFFMQRFLRSRTQFSRYLFDSLALQTMPSRVIEIFAVLGLFILIVIAKWTGHDDHGALLTVGAFMAAAYKIIPGIVKVINTTGQMKAYEFAADELDHPGEAARQSIQKEYHPRIDLIQLKNIGFRFGTQPVLNEVSLDLKPGDFIGISGKSGIGKTTLLNLLLGFLEPSAGEISINGSPVSYDQLRQYWSQIAYVRQEPFFIHDTILRNITLEERDPDSKQLTHALSFSGLNDMLNEFPEGAEKVITENGKNISGGQKQRITLARAIYKNANLLLLDEPFNELDEASANSILQRLSGLTHEGKIIVLITHDQKSLTFCNKILSLHGQD